VCEVDASETSRVISGSYDHSLKVWDLVKCQKVRSLRGHKGSISALQLGTANRLISGSYDNTLQVWDHRNAKSTMTLNGHTAPVMCILWDGCLQGAPSHLVISGSRDTTIRVWDLRTGKTIHSLAGHSDWLKTLWYNGAGSGGTMATGGDANTLASGGCDGVVKVWDINDGRCLSTFTGHAGTIHSVMAMGADRETQKFVSCSADSTVKIWQSSHSETEPLTTLVGHTDEVLTATPFLGNTLITASFDGTLRVWDSINGSELRTIPIHSGHRISCMRSHENCIVTAGWDKLAKICEFSLDFRPT